MGQMVNHGIPQTSPSSYFDQKDIIVIPFPHSLRSAPEAACEALGLMGTAVAEPRIAGRTEKLKLQNADRLE